MVVKTLWSLREICNEITEAQMLAGIQDAVKTGVEVANEDCDVLTGELSSEELDATQKRMVELFEEIQQWNG